jgi:hypothetical protein
MKHWIAVASAEHVRLGRGEGFMQVCHGKAAPLRRISPGDGVAYYSPTVTFKVADKLQAFTAIGIAKPNAPYQVAISADFHPYRRDVTWLEALETPIRPLLDRLAFTAAKPNWGYQLRLGLFEICQADMRLIADAMRAELSGRPNASLNASFDNKRMC